jgi:hypothetical protein
LDLVDPGQGTSQGGEVVRVLGWSLPANAQVTFGVDPTTGAGGVAAASVTFLDEGTLEVVTPAQTVGLTAVLVFNPATGQGSILPGGFFFQGSSSSGGGGGGGCGAVIPQSDGTGGGPGIREPLAGLAWILAALALAAHRARQGIPARDA